MNHVDKRFGERDRLIRFGDAQVRSSKVAKNGYVRRIRFERPPYGGVDDQRPTMLSLAKLLGVPSGRRTVSSASASAAASEFSGSWAAVNGWARAYTVNT